jgi:hypothetical protein
MDCKGKDLSPEPEFGEFFAEDEALLQAFNSSVVERAHPCSSR